MRKRRKRVLPFAVLFILCLTVFFAGKSLGLTQKLLPLYGKYADEPANKKIIEDTAQDQKNPGMDDGNKAEASAKENDVQANEGKEAGDNSASKETGSKYIIKNLDDTLILVNKSRNLPSDWVPDDLVVPNVAFAFKEDLPKKKMRKVAADALEELFQKAKEDNIGILAISGYRSYQTQKAIFESNVKRYGEEEANMVSARPGQSEHQTGLAMDVTSASVNFGLEESFGNTAEGKWLKENAPDFGFIIRYSKDKENITKYSYEPWHIRYVGKEAARAITDRNITLEEYLNILD